jgi:hypothetical protein
MMVDHNEISVVGKFKIEFPSDVTFVDLILFSVDVRGWIEKRKQMIMEREMSYIFKEMGMDALDALCKVVPFYDSSDDGLLSYIWQERAERKRAEMGLNDNLGQEKENEDGAKLFVETSIG